MANRVLLLLAMASRNDPSASPKILNETAGQFIFIIFFSITVMQLVECKYRILNYKKRKRKNVSC